MAKIITLRIRHDVRATKPGSDAVRRQRVQAFSEDVDLDRLTPRARALAEALADAQRAPLPLTRMTVVQETPRTIRETNPTWEAMVDLVDPDQLATRSINLPPLAADRPETAEWWLEHQARDQGPDWYPVSAIRGERVPSWRAGAADRHLTVDQVLDRLRGTSAAIGIQGWDTLRGTGILAPDRHVMGRPQWHEETVDAFARRSREVWPLSRVAEYLHLTPGSARVQLRRWGIPAEARAAGRGGESLYPADLVQAVHAHRPGRGTRTDLREEKPGF
jgi:hypothetical protein